MILGLELCGRRDGTAMLNYWDSLGGNDTVLRLSADGSVHELSFSDSDNDVGVWTPVDLAMRLLELCKDTEQNNVP